MIRRPPSSPLFPYPPLSRSPVGRNLGDRGVARRGPPLLEQPLEPLRAVPPPPPPHHRLRHAGPPRLDRLPDRDGDVGEERPEFVGPPRPPRRSEEHTSELQSRLHLVCRLLLEKKKKIQQPQ